MPVSWWYVNHTTDSYSCYVCLTIEPLMAWIKCFCWEDLFIKYLKSNRELLQLLQFMYDGWNPVLFLVPYYRSLRETGLVDKWKHMTWYSLIIAHQNNSILIQWMTYSHLTPWRNIQNILLHQIIPLFHSYMLRKRNLGPFYILQCMASAPGVVVSGASASLISNPRPSFGRCEHTCFKHEVSPSHSPPKLG